MVHLAIHFVWEEQWGKYMYEILSHGEQPGELARSLKEVLDGL